MVCNNHIDKIKNILESETISKNEFSNINDMKMNFILQKEKSNMDLKNLCFGCYRSFENCNNKEDFFNYFPKTLIKSNKKTTKEKDYDLIKEYFIEDKE